MIKNYEVDSFEFNMKLDIQWSQFLNHTTDVNAFIHFFRQGKLFYLINMVNCKEKYLLEEDSEYEILHPLQFPEPARIFVKTTKKEEHGFTIEYLILSKINNVITVISTGYSKMLLFNKSKAQ